MVFELKVNDPLIGWFADGLPDELTPPTAVMLVDDGDQIVLHIPWTKSTSAPHFQISRWFTSGATWGDDPGGTKYSYLVPDEIIFQTPKGFAVLVGCEARSYNSNSSWGVGVGRASVTYAVLGGRMFGYSKVNGLRSQIHGLSEWMGLDVIRKYHSKVDGVEGLRRTLIGDEVPRKRIHRKKNLGIVPKVIFGETKSDVVQLEDMTSIESRMAREESLEGHLEAHAAVRDLISVSYWQAAKYEKMSVMRIKDSESLPEGDETIERWCELRSHQVVGLAEGGTLEGRPWFRFPDIGTVGFSRWISLRGKYARGVNPIIHSIENHSAFVETSFVDMCIGFEYIGYVLLIDQGVSKSRAARVSVKDRIQAIVETLRIPIFTDGMAERCAVAYNGIKHANRTYPDFNETFDCRKVLTLIFRLWVSVSIGLTSEKIRSALLHDSSINYLIEHKLVHPVSKWDF